MDHLVDLDLCSILAGAKLCSYDAMMERLIQYGVLLIGPDFVEHAGIDGEKVDILPVTF